MPSFPASEGRRSKRVMLKKRASLVVNLDRDEKRLPCLVLVDEVLTGRKALTNLPRKCLSDAIIAGITLEKSEASFAPSHSFCRCTTFWLGTGVSRQH
jgi:hypothetical protein